MEAGLGKSLEGQNARGLKKVADRARHWRILLGGAENMVGFTPICWAVVQGNELVRPLDMILKKR